jgi:putative tryptophan/tyrosine transport system substrate-binding protein
MRNSYYLGIYSLLLMILLVGCNSSDSIPTPVPTDTPETTYRIGIARWVTNEEYDRNITAFKTALADAGYIEGVNVIYMEENPNADRDVQRTIIQDFVDSDIDLIYSLTTPGTLIAKEIALEIPIVFSIVTFPVESGLIESMAVSGNNLVGTSNWISIDKQLFALHSIVPDARTIGFVHRAGEPNSVIQFERMETVSEKHNLTIIDVAANSVEEIQDELLAVTDDIDALFLACDTLIQSGGEEIVIAVALEHQIPTLSCNKSSIHKGALIGDIADFANIGELAGAKAVQVLNGTAPTNLTSESQRGSYLIINLQTADLLNLTVSDNILGISSEVIR